MKGFDFFLRNSHFTWVWMGQILSQSGARMVQMAMVWWIVSHLGVDAGKWTGLFMVAVAIPPLLFSRFIGKCVDTFSSSRILVLTDSCTSVLLGCSSLIVKERDASLALLLATGFLVACCQSLIDPALNKSLYELIPKNDRYPEDQENGVALFATTQSLSNFGGAVLGAVTIGVMGMSQILLMACLFYFTASRFSKKAVFFSSTIDSPSKGDSGWEFLKRFGLLKKMVIGFGVVNFFTVPTLVILPLYTKKILGADSITLGALEGALWVGLFAGALGSRWVPESVDKLVIAGVCLLVLGITFCIPAFAVQSVLYGTMLFVSGLVLGVNNVKFLSLFQQVVPAEVKGRFFALLQYLIGASFPLGYFVFGWLCDLMSVRQTCLVQGMGVLLVSHYFWFLRRRISTGELSWESK